MWISNPSWGSVAFVKSLSVCLVLLVFHWVCCLCVPVCFGQSERRPRRPHMKVLNEKFWRLVRPGGKLTHIASNALFIICVCLTAHSVMNKRGQPNENKHHVQNKLKQKLPLKVTTSNILILCLAQMPTY